MRAAARAPEPRPAAPRHRSGGEPVPVPVLVPVMVPVLIPVPVPLTAVRVQPEAAAAPRPSAVPAGGGRGNWFTRAVGSLADAAGAALAAAGQAARRVVRERAALLPGYELLGFALGRDPLSGTAIERTPAALIRGLVGLWPGGVLLRRGLDRYGLVDRVGGWLGRQLATLAAVAGAVLGALESLLRSLGLADLLDPGRVWARARSLVLTPAQRLWSFVQGLAVDVVGFLREAVLMPLSRLAWSTRGYPLLCMVLARDPLLGTAVARDPHVMIGQAMALIGQQERWQQLQQARAVPRAWAWVQTQLRLLHGFVTELPGLLRGFWQTLSAGDLLNLPAALARMAAPVRGLVARVSRWAGRAALQLVQAMVEVLAPGAMPVLRRAGGALGTIFRDPVRFVGHLVRAGVAGFRQFLTNVGTHLGNGLTGWLTGTLGGAGLVLPTVWDLRGVLSLVLQILGLTWSYLRAKLVRASSERVVAALEAGFTLVVTLVREGPVAAWRQLLEHLASLRDTVMEQVRDWVARTVVGQAVLRIAGMLNPAGAVIQAILAIYNTVVFVRERLQQIAQVAEAFVDSMAAIAAGRISAAADRVEQTMGRTVPVVISFLARLLGLGGIADTVRRVIERVRAPVDRAMDRVVDWIVVQARRLAGAVVGAARGVAARAIQWWTAERRVRAPDGEHRLYIEGGGTRRRVMMASTPALLRGRIAAMSVPAALRSRQTAALGILDRLDAAMAAAAGTGAAAADAGARIDGLMGELALETAALLGAGAAGVSTPPLFGPLAAGGLGSSVAVERLTAGHGAGSEPSAGGGLWATLARRMDGGSTYYVRGHLLNHHVGGSGANWQNLTPLTQATNNRSAVSMLHGFERQVKQAVDVPAAALNLSVRVTYGRPARNAAVQERRASGDADDAVIADIIEAERQVPTAVHAVAHRVTPDGRRSTLVSARIENRIDTRDDSYSLGGRPRVPLNLNAADAAGLRGLAGVDAATAARIAAARPLRDRDDFRARLGDVLWHRIASTAGVRLRFR